MTTPEEANDPEQTASTADEPGHDEQPGRQQCHWPAGGIDAAGWAGTAEATRTLVAATVEVFANRDIVARHIERHGRCIPEAQAGWFDEIMHSLSFNQNAARQG